MRRWFPFLLLANACLPHRPPTFDADLAACLPPATAAIAGLDLHRLRTTPLGPKLPFPEASYLLAASDGRDWLVLARGTLPGGTPVAPGLTALGSEALVEAAIAQHRTGRTGAADDLLQHASDAPIWMAARGNITLPLKGNLSNFNRLLRQTEYTTLTARAGDHVDIDATGICRGAGQAQALEENARALASLLLPRYPVEVASNGSVVHVRLSLSAETVARLFAP